MIDVPIIISVVITLISVVLISLSASRLKSLPVDVVSAAVSVVLIFVDAANRFAGDHAERVSKNSIYTVSFVIAVSIVFVVICIGVFVAAEAEKSSKNRSSKKKSMVYSEVGYCASLAISTLFVVYAFSVANSVPILLDIKYDEGGQLFKIFDDINSQFNVVLLIKIAICFYMLLIAGRYSLALVK